MKILLLNVCCKRGSTGKIVYDLFTQLNQLGHTAEIAYGRGEKINESGIYKFSLDFETCFHALLTRITGLTGVYSPLSTRRLIRYIKKFNPDVVHIHELHAYYVNIAPVINFLKKRNIKTIWTFHCEFMYTGKCGFAYDCTKWMHECKECPQVHEYPRSLFFDFTKKMFNEKKRLLNGFDNLTIVTPSQWLYDRVQKSFLGNKMIRVIYNGIDTDKIFYPRPAEELKVKYNLTDTKIVLSVAPNIMSERKGGSWVLRLAERFINKNVKFILLGIDDLNQKFGSNVIAIGRTYDQNILAEYYSMADVFLICSKMENLPTTCIEALCCGTPVVGFNVGGVTEIAPEGYGSFVEYGDIVGLQSILYDIIENKSNMKSKAECSKYGISQFSKKNMLHNYNNTYIS